jgi:hypothetical protein
MKTMTKEDRAQAEVCYSIFTNAGMIADEESPTGWATLTDGEPARYTINDLISKTDLTRWIPTVIQYIVREALEPNLLLVPNLFTPLNLPGGRLVQIGAIGAMAAAMIPEGR